MSYITLIEATLHRIASIASQHIELARANAVCVCMGISNKRQTINCR